MTDMTWPMNGSELVRALGLPHESYYVLEIVRPLLAELGCPKTGTASGSNWLVDQEMAKRVENVLRERGFTVQRVA
jgi:hypothetical protein